MNNYLYSKNKKITYDEPAGSMDFYGNSIPEDNKAQKKKGKLGTVIIMVLAAAAALFTFRFAESAGASATSYEISYNGSVVSEEAAPLEGELSSPDVCTAQTTSVSRRIGPVSSSSMTDSRSREESTSKKAESKIKSSSSEGESRTDKSSSSRSDSSLAGENGSSSDTTNKTVGSGGKGESNTFEVVSSEDSSSQTASVPEPIVVDLEEEYDGYEEYDEYEEEDSEPETYSEPIIEEPMPDIWEYEEDVFAEVYEEVIDHT